MVMVIRVIFWLIHLCLVNGQTTVIVGRVSMDMITIDLTDIEAQLGDSVTLWGDGLSADTIAPYANSIGYELFCQVTPRVRRFLPTLNGNQGQLTLYVQG
jgi:alanine racemase